MDYTPAPALRVSNLRKTYDNGVEALKGVSLDVAPGDFYALLGPNGCGKSTIVKLILRLYEPDSGEILLNGEKIETFSREQVLKLFGVLFQDYAKYPV